MKQYFIVLVLVVFALATRAQDVIVLTSNAEIKGKVINVDSLTVTYRNNSSDVIHKLPKNTVTAIRYGNGSQKIFNLPNMADRITADSVRHMNTYTDYMTIARKRTKTGIVLSALGAPALAGGIALMVLGDKATKQNSERPDSLRSNHGGFFVSAMGALFIAGGVTLEVTGMSMFLTARKYRRKAKEVKSLISIAPTVQPIPRAGNIYGSYTGLAMNLTF